MNPPRKAPKRQPSPTRVSPAAFARLATLHDALTTEHEAAVDRLDQWLGDMARTVKGATERIIALESRLPAPAPPAAPVLVNDREQGKEEPNG